MGGFVYYLNVLKNCSGNQTCLDAARVSEAREFFESAEHRQQHLELDPNSPNFKAAYISNCYRAFNGVRKTLGTAPTSPPSSPG